MANWHVCDWSFSYVEPPSFECILSCGENQCECSGPWIRWKNHPTIYGRDWWIVGNATDIKMDSPEVLKMEGKHAKIAVAIVQKSFGMHSYKFSFYSNHVKWWRLLHFGQTHSQLGTKRKRSHRHKPSEMSKKLNMPLRMLKVDCSRNEWMCVCVVMTVLSSHLSPFKMP